MTSTRPEPPSLPGMPRDDNGPVFAAPWQAQAFAMALSLYDKGLFTWPEWAAALSSEISRAQAAGDPDTGETYYLHWLAALEADGRRKENNDTGCARPLSQAWDAAADRTPHGAPIELQPEDFRT